MRGPIPKRSEQRRHRNKLSGPPPRSGKGSGRVAWSEYARTLGLEVPDGATRTEILALIDAASSPEHWHPLATEWFESLRLSGQSAWYQPSDWATARVLAQVLTQVLEAETPNATLFGKWMAGATELLTTEGARRRLRIELDQPSDDQAQDGDDVSELDEWRRRLRSSG